MVQQRETAQRVELCEGNVVMQKKDNVGEKHQVCFSSRQCSKLLLHVT